MERDSSSKFMPSIPEFFKGKTILITGGTGFMGKVLIEKLLWSCSDLERIYLLLRPKRGKLPELRLQELEKSMCFERLRKHKPGFFFEKIKCISGNVTEIGLDLSPEERKILIDSVNIIFHLAASVKFDDPLRYSVIMNTRGSREIMCLANEMKNLYVLLHISTTYCNTDKNPVYEVLYPAHADWRKTIDIVENADDHTLRILTPKYIDRLPNTYTFSKGLAEHVVNDLRGNVTAIIFRPSIVISALSEPMPGWIENFHGPVGILIASGKGIMRSIYTNNENKADFMPVDIAIKAMIVASWKHGTQKKRSENPIPVYNCCSNDVKNVMLQEIIDMGLSLYEDVPLNNIVWAPGGSITKWRFYHFIRVMIYHILPAIALDLFLKLTGRKPRVVKLQRRIYVVILALQYFIINKWIFKNDRLTSLRPLIQECDQDHFNYNFEVEDIYIYFKRCVLGGRRYLLNETDETIPQARKEYKRMYILDQIVRMIFWAWVFWFLFNSKFVENCILKLISFLPLTSYVIKTN